MPARIAPALRVFALSLVLVVTLAPTRAHSQISLDSTWVTDGTVTSMVATGSTVFLGGQFTKVAHWISPAAALDRTSTLSTMPPIRYNGSIVSAVSDSAGGWYVGGTFNTIQGKIRRGLAHLLADGSVSDWDPGAESKVRALLVVDGKLYVGGSFGTADGIVRTRLAVFDLRTGAILSWHPAVTGSGVTRMTRSGNELIVTGDLNQVDGSYRGLLAAFDLTTGGLESTTFEMPSDGGLSAITAANGTLYYGGTFTQIGHARSGGVAIVDSATGFSVAPDFDATGTTNIVVADGHGGWYVGGSFTAVQQQPRANLAHIGADGHVDGWNPGANNHVDALALNHDTLFVGGAFSTCGGRPHASFAALSTTSDSALAMNLDANSGVARLAIDGRTLFVQGLFTHVSNVDAEGLASLDAGTGLGSPRQPWTPNGTVQSLAAANGRLYVGGTFPTMRRRTGNFVTLDEVSAALTPPNPSLVYSSSGVGAVLPDGSGGWYLGGGYGFPIQGQVRYGLAHVRPDGSLDSWAPWVSGSVQAMVIVRNTLFVGGSFTWAASNYDSSFTGRRVRNSLAAFDLASGQVLAWSAPLDANGTVTSLAAIGDTLYVAGTFTQLGTQLRSTLGSVHVVTGAVTDWNPSPIGGNAATLASENRTLYVGGAFYSIDSQYRVDLAAFDPATGHVTDWAPPPISNAVFALAVDGNTLYAGGSFTNVGPSLRNRLAAFDVATAQLTNWNPSADNNVFTLEAGNSVIYAGGLFTQAGGSSRPYLAAIDSSTGVARSWSAYADGAVISIRSAGGIVAVGGGFLTCGTGSPIARANLAALDATTGTVTQFNANVNGTVSAIAPAAAGVYLGGSFTLAGGAARGNLAEVTLAGSALPWSPAVNAPVSALALSGPLVYVGGSFTTLAGAPRKSVGSCGAGDGVVTSWNPSANGAVSGLVPAAAKVCVTGGFTTIGDVPRVSLAAVNLATGLLTPWNPASNGAVNTMVVRDTTLYVGGHFTTMNGVTRNHLAAIGATAGATLAWDPNAVGGDVFTLDRSGDTLYCLGAFPTIAGVARGGFAAVSATTGAALPWNPELDSVPGGLALDASSVFVFGDFHTYHSVPRANLAAFDAVTLAPRAWNPGSDAAVNVLSLSGGTLYAGGEFSTIGGQPRHYLAALDTASDVSTAWNPNPDGQVLGLQASGGTLYVAGSFRAIGGAARRFLAAVDAASGLATPWDPNPDRVVQCLAVSGSTVYVGGPFTFVGGQSRKILAGLDAVTGLTTAWDPNPDAQVRVIVPTPGSVYVGGVFNTLGGLSRPMLAALDPVTGRAQNFKPDLGTPNAAYYVDAILPANGTLYVGGVFSAPGGRRNVAAIRTDTGASTNFVIAPNASVSSLIRARGRLFVGGAFSSMGADPRRSLAGFVDPEDPGIVGVPPAPKRFEFALAQNTPNPFRRTSTIRFTLPREGAVKLTLFDTAGRAVQSVIGGATLPAGEHEVRVGDARLAPGLYWYRLEWNGQAQAKRLVALP